jgi:hypothetical protein
MKDTPETLIEIGGVTRPISELTLPEDWDKFRDALVLTGDVVTIDREKLLRDERASASLSRFEFATRAAQAGFVTYPEAAAWATGQAMPANVQALIETLPEEQRGPILLDVLAMPAIRRNGSIMPAIIAAFGATEEQADALFGIGV